MAGAMSFAAQIVYANLAEKEKIKGHHSAEGTAIRTLSRALQGWTSESLFPADVLSMCHQAIEDWLKARLNISAWSATTLPDLLPQAVATRLVTRLEAVRLQRMHDLGSRSSAVVRVKSDIENALECCIQVVEKHW